jgi:hypothetical protein
MLSGVLGWDCRSCDTQERGYSPPELHVADAAEASDGEARFVAA